MKTMASLLLVAVLATGAVRADDDCCKSQKVAAAVAAGAGGSGYRPRVLGVRHGDTGQSGLRTAPAGTQNLVVCVGGSADGSHEHRYAKAIHRIVGGAIFEGGFGQDDVVGYIAGLGKSGTKVANIYFIGHITGFMADNKPVVDELRKHDENLVIVENMVGFVHVGRSPDGISIPHLMNLGDGFNTRLDAAMTAQGVTPAECFAPDVRVVFRVCNTNKMMRPFLDRLAARIPGGGEIVAYNEPYVWMTGNSLLPTMFHSYLRPEQTRGRVTIRGTWKRPAIAAPPAPPAPAGMGAPGRPGAGGALAAAGPADGAVGLLGVAGGGAASLVGEGVAAPPGTPADGLPQPVEPPPMDAPVAP